MSTVVNSEDLSDKQWQTNTTAQLVSASISFLASLLIVASTSKSFFSVAANEERNNQDRPRSKKKKKKQKNTSPYRRIIFLISASDIFHSLAFITGPFMAQKTNPQARWGVSDSNIACVVNGTFFYTGGVASLLYYAALCYFYYCKISKRMTDGQFTQRYEKKIHTTISVICIANACLSFAANTFHTYPTGTVCTNANTPAGCNQQPEIYGECDAKIKVYVSYFACFSLVVSIYSIVVILYSMIRLIYSVLNKDRIYGNLPADPTQEQLHKYTLRKQLLRETMSQAIMYTVSWFICQSATLAMAFLIFFREVPIEKFSAVFQIYYSALIPLNSAFNVFIYTRPAVRHVRRADPSISRFQAFYMVLQEGGEAPNMEQSSLQQQPQPDISSREPFRCEHYYDGNDLCVSLDHLNDISSVDLNVMISHDDSVERIAISSWPELDIATNSEFRGLENGSVGKNVSVYHHYYDPRPILGGEKNIMIEERFDDEGEECAGQDSVELVLVSTWSREDPLNYNIDPNSGIHGLEEGSFFGQGMNNEYSHNNDEMLESSGRITEDNAADSNVSHIHDGQGQEDLDKNSSIYVSHIHDGQGQDEDLDKNSSI
ncbi:hypothetical protein CTEN210_06649 [Chaetoceros tenuissimus]|uniref:G-protein coupled receptors family 1 profile domain-containing protein n=1 Tax=Chaetoceros tenuissimus TaxID=426638 RepID=A0AAD3CQS4_9STRA|nr:hypothetical protein CTEN210_06649 [Chaetoceros tenuissimus]